MLRFCFGPSHRTFTIALFLAATMAPAALSAADWPPVEIDAATEKIEGALGDPTALEFIETPLADVAEFLKDLHGIEIQIDHKHLEDVGIGSDTPITLNLKGVTLRSALNLMLRELDLTFEVRDEVLLITTPEAAEERAYTQVYNVAPLLNEKDNAEELRESIVETLPDDSPKRSISMFRGQLILHASYRDHRKVRALLGTIATSLAVEPPQPKVARERPMPMGVIIERPRAVEERRAEEAADPFGGAADPFGAGGADPFGDPDRFGGGGADPFGVEDPFGGGGDADPFKD